MSYRIQSPFGGTTAQWRRGEDLQTFDREAQRVLRAGGSTYAEPC